MMLKFGGRNMNRNKLIIRTGDIFWCSSIRKNFHIKTRPFLVVENKETYILALALTSNVSNKEIVLHQYALSKDSAVLFNNLYRINKKRSICSFICKVSKEEFAKIESILKKKKPKIISY